MKYIYQKMLHILNFLAAISVLSAAIQLSISGRIDGIIGPSLAVGNEGHWIILMWNTTNFVPIKSAIFGLSNKGMADPQFINVNTLTGKVHYNPEISKTYLGRVAFVGNLTAGQAWFIIKKLQLNDTNEYLARITIDVDTVKSYTVSLRVRQPNRLKSDNRIASTLPSTSTTTFESEEATPLGPNKKVVKALKYTLAFTIVLVLILTLSVTYYITKRNKPTKHEKQQEHSEKGCSISQAKESLISNGKEDDLELHNGLKHKTRI